jgi:hypothetical protein
VTEKMERETGFEPATSSLGISASIEYKEQWRSRGCTQIQGNQQLPKPISQNTAYRRVFGGYDCPIARDQRHVIHFGLLASNP